MVDELSYMNSKLTNDILLIFEIIIMKWRELTSYKHCNSSSFEVTGCLSLSMDQDHISVDLTKLIRYGCHLGT